MKTATEIATDITRRYNEEEFAPGESELDMVHAAVKTAIEESRKGSIFVITYVSRDDDNYRVDTIEENHGFFFTREEAQEWVDAQHKFDEKYPQYVRQMEAANANRKHENEVRRRVWDEMKAEGVNPGFFRPTEHRDYPIQTFERWASNNTVYDVVEVEPHA